MGKKLEPAALRPFLKWAGSKYRIIDRVRRKLPQGERLIEPFTGSGAVFLNTRFDHYLLCDSNADLIDLFSVLRDEGREFIEHARQWFDGRHNTEAGYYDLREEFNASTDAADRAALFIYLNRHGYNGLCRYNTKGRFNVPYGRYKRPYFPEKELLAFHHKAQDAEFAVQCFSATMQGTGQGDVIYCDPPYVPLSLSANFTAYSAGGFSLQQQQQLAELARHNAERGVPVLISNHSTDFTRRLYRTAKAQLNYFSVQRTISCNGNKRNKASELLALFQTP